MGKDDRIPPRKSVTQVVEVSLPPGADAVDLRARSLYKSVPDELATRAGVKNPTTTMAEATKRIFATDAAKAAEAGKQRSSDASAQPTEGEPGRPVTVPLLICTGLLVLARALTIALVRRAGRSDGENDLRQRRDRRPDMRHARVCTEKPVPLNASLRYHIRTRHRCRAVSIRSRRLSM